MSMVREHGAWLSPNHYDAASGWLKLSIHSWLLKVGGKRILIDNQSRYDIVIDNTGAPLASPFVTISSLGGVRFNGLLDAGGGSVSLRTSSGNISMTLDTYSHVVKGLQHEAAEKVAALLVAAGVIFLVGGALGVPVWIGVADALKGQKSSVVRVNDRGEVIVSVAVPVQRFRAVHGSLMLSTQGADIDDLVEAERLAIFKVFLVAAAVMVIPRSRSCSIQSVVAFPSCTSPIL